MLGDDITIGSSILIDAIVTGGATTYSWSEESGTGNISFGTPSAEDTTIAANTNGTYVIRLTTQDALGNTAWDEINYTWDNTGVSVNIGSDLAIKTNAEGAITPTISNEGGAPNYLWSQVSGPGTLTFSPNATSRNLSGISANLDGSYVIRLTVTNTNNSNTGLDDLTLVWDTSVPSITNVDAAGDIASSPYLMRRLVYQQILLYQMSQGPADACGIHSNHKYHSMLCCDWLQCFHSYVR